MRVCLINPGYLLDSSENDVLSMSGFTVPHLGLGYISSLLRKKGYIVDLFECMGQEMTNREVLECIKTYDYSVIGVSVYDGNRINAMRIVNRIRKMKPNIFIFLGGYGPTLSYESILANFDADCCVIGEGEITTLELVGAIEKGNDFRKIKGIAYLEDGEIIVSEKRTLVNDLDILPFPERAFYKNKTLTMITSRGCLCNCIYCSIVSFYRKNVGVNYRMRSAENVVEELKSLLEKYPDCELIWYYDDNFLQGIEENKVRLFKMCSLLKKNNINIPFNITACSKDIVESEELLIELKAVGLNQVFVGIESLCQRQLDFYNKKTTVEKNIQAINVLNKLGLKVNMGFIPLDPFVSVEELKESFEKLLCYNIMNDAFNIFSIHMHVVSVKGTPLREILDRKGITKNNERGYDFLDDDIKVVHEMINRWHQIMLPMVSKSDLIALYEEKDISKYNLLVKSYNALIRLDIEYVISLCEHVKTQEYSEKTLKKHIERWEIKYNSLYVKFNNALGV